MDDLVDPIFQKTDRFSAMAAGVQAMELIIRKRDCYVTFVILAVFAAVVLHHRWDTHKIDQQLNAWAEAAVIENLGDPSLLKDWDVVAMCESAKTFHVAGPAWGAIHVFMREKGDEEMKTFKGIEYYLKRQDGRWIEVDSAGCGALSHHVDGFKEFERRGMKVATDAYDRALGFKKAPPVAKGPKEGANTLAVDTQGT